VQIGRSTELLGTNSWITDERRAKEMKQSARSRIAAHFSKREYMMGDHQRKVIQELLIDSSRTSRDGKELAT